MVISSGHDNDDPFDQVFVAQRQPL